MMQQLDERDYKILKLKTQVAQMNEGLITARSDGSDAVLRKIKTSRSNSAAKNPHPDTFMEAYKTSLPPKNPEFGSLFQQISRKHQR
jgi:hypothetical protein